MRILPMRILLLVTASALTLVAGCADTSPGSSSSPPAPTSSSNSGNHGIAVGEPNPGQPGGMTTGGMTHPGSGASVRPTHADNTSHELNLVGDQDRSSLVPGGLVNFTFTATNVGADARVVGPCDTPWSFTLRDSNGTQLAMHPPTFRCLAYSESAFLAGAKVSSYMLWNGTIVLDGEHYTNAPYGTYTVTARFYALRGEARPDVTVALPVSIVTMGQQ